tara:strand:+ start:188 stop:412 length:225 start_codon:yes stop_codon:yes gene_type:complete
VDFEAEADRLLGLDEAGRDRELVIVALRLGEAAKQAWLELRQLDVEFLNAITGNRRGDVGPSEGAESLFEHVDA